MSAYRVVQVRPLEPLHLGVRNLGTAEEFFTDESTAVPPPSTILGALGNAMGILLSIDCGKVKGGVYDFDDLKQLAHKLLNCSPNLGDLLSQEPCLWGPLLLIDGKYYAPMGIRAIGVDGLKAYVNASMRGQDEAKKLIDELNKMFIQYASINTRVGVDIGDAHVTEAMFKSSYVNYRDHDVKFIYLLKNLNLTSDIVIRLGGEGRFALIEGGNNVEPPRAGKYAVALQPILFSSEDPTADVGNVRGLKCVEEVYGVFDGEKFKVRVINIGLGFSEVCRFRRPILQALPQGTVVRLKDECRDALAIGLLSELGYGSIYRVSL